MLKFLYVARISNFFPFLQIFSSDIKHFVLSYLDELLSLPYMVGKLEMSNFQPNFNHGKISPTSPDVLNSTQMSSLTNLTRFV